MIEGRIYGIECSWKSITRDDYTRWLPTMTTPNISIFHVTKCL